MIGWFWQSERNGSTFSDDENSKYTFTLLAQQVRDAAMNSSVVAAATSSTHRMMASSHLSNSSDLTQVSQQIQQMKEMEYRLKQHQFLFFIFLNKAQSIY